MINKRKISVTISALVAGVIVVGTLMNQTWTSAQPVVGEDYGTVESEENSTSFSTSKSTKNTSVQAKDEFAEFDALVNNNIMNRSGVLDASTKKTGNTTSEETTINILDSSVIAFGDIETNDRVKEKLAKETSKKTKSTTTSDKTKKEKSTTTTVISEEEMLIAAEEETIEETTSKKERSTTTTEKVTTTTTTEEPTPVPTTTTAEPTPVPTTTTAEPTPVPTTTTAEPTPVPTTTTAAPTPVPTTTTVEVTTTTTTEAPTETTTTVNSGYVYIDGLKPMSQEEYRVYQITSNAGYYLGATSQPGSSSYYAGWCAWYVYNARYAVGRPIPTNLGNASTWASRAANMGYTVTGVPTVGAVACDSAGDHVMFVEAVYADGSILVSETAWMWTPFNHNKRVISAAQASWYLYIA